MNIGDNIKKFRSIKGISQKDLAKLLDNMPISTLANYENNHRKPNIEILTKIARALEVNIDALMIDEYFDRELFDRAVKIALRNSKSMDDAFTELGLYADYSTLVEFNHHFKDYLPTDCIKGLLNFISKKSKDEYNKIYYDLILTNVYELDPELKDYCKKLHSNTMDLLDYIYDQKLDLLKESDYNNKANSEHSQFKTTEPKVTNMNLGQSIVYFLKFLNSNNYPIDNLDNKAISYLYEKVTDTLEFEFFKLKKNNYKTPPNENEKNK